MSSTNVRVGDTIVKNDIFNIAVTANTDIFSTVMTPTTVPLAYFVIYATFQAAGRLVIKRIKSGVSVLERLNEDSDLKVNTAYMFIIPVSEGETVNMQYTTSTTASKLMILEIMRELN
jgi:hypothetical protein